jgi:hypothetical protein
LDLIGSRLQQLVFLNTHWGGRYSFSAPTGPDGRWTARARFGPGDEVDGLSAAELLERVRLHYRRGAAHH